MLTPANPFCKTSAPLRSFKPYQKSSLFEAGAMSLIAVHLST
jgi:hypothetical protein